MKILFDLRVFFDLKQLPEKVETGRVTLLETLVDAGAAADRDVVVNLEAGIVNEMTAKVKLQMGADVHVRFEILGADEKVAANVNAQVSRTYMASCIYGRE